jgi:lipid-A-disaccharide synthase
LTSQKSILVSAGEVSGDHYAARLAVSLRERGFEGRLFGLCGEESRNAGVEAIWSNERLHLLGIVEVLSSAADVLRLMREVCSEIVRTGPQAVLVIDSPDFHLRLIKRLRRLGYRGKIIYISPPSVWAWRSYRVKTLARDVDLCLPLFLFEHEYLTKHGCNSGWIGHPLAEEILNRNSEESGIPGEIRGRGSAFDEGRMIALLPGSRRVEIENLYGALSGAYDILTKEGYSPVFSVAPGLSDAARSTLLARIDLEGRAYFEGAGRDLLDASLMALGSSGTVTIEALLLRRYMVVMYRLKPLSALIGRLLLGRIRFALPNILAGEEFFPELLQGEATGEVAAAKALAWLHADDVSRAKCAAKIEDLVQMMGESGVYDFWSDSIMKTAL